MSLNFHPLEQLEAKSYTKQKQTHTSYTMQVKVYIQICSVYKSTYAAECMQYTENYTWRYLY